MLQKFGLTPQNSFKYIYKLTTLWKLTPYWNFKMNHPGEWNLLLIFHSILVVCLNIGFFVANYYKTKRLLGKNLLKIERVVLTGRTVAAFTETTLALLHCWRKSWQPLLKYVVRCLGEQRQSNQQIGYQFLLGNFLFFMSIVLQVYVNCVIFKPTVISFLTFFLTFYYDYTNFLNGCTVYNILWVLNNNYIHLGELLKKNYLGNREQSANVRTLQEIYVKYKETNDFGALLNGLLGNVILFKLFSVAALLLMTLYSDASIFSELKRHGSLSRSTVQTLLNNCPATCNFMSILVLLFAYHTIQENALKVHFYLYDILQEHYGRSDICRRLSCVVVNNQRGCTFSANQFFLLNRGTLFGLISNVFYYLIVIIQSKEIG